MQHGVRPFPGLERTMAIQITGILCWTLLCEVILTEYYFPERAVADNLTAWKISRVKYDGALLSEIPMEGMKEQSRTRCWRDASILGSCCPLKMKHGRIFWKGGRIRTVVREHVIIGYLHWSMMNKCNSLFCPAFFSFTGVFTSCRGEFSFSSTKVFFFLYTHYS